MASTITASTLKVTIQEDIKLNGVQQGGKNTLNIGSVNDFSVFFRGVFSIMKSQLLFDSRAARNSIWSDSL